MAVHRADGVLTDEVDGHAFLIGREGTHVVELNGVGSAVWSAIDGARDLDALVEVVRTTCPGADRLPADRVRGDVVAFVTELRRLALVDP